MKFSEREGYSKVKEIQLEKIDLDLKNRLWNLISIQIMDKIVTPGGGFTARVANKYYNFVKNGIWMTHFNLLSDDFRNLYFKETIREIFYEVEWYEIYNLLEFIAQNLFDEKLIERFITLCNSILKIEKSGWRFVGNIITRITSREEILEIEEVLNNEELFRPVSIHIKTALDLFANKISPDYRNSIKESISAVEAMCQIVTGTKATLGQALKKIEENTQLHPALKEGFNKLYGYSSNSDGIRHALMDVPNLRFEDAKFMLVTCSAFINYLKEKI